MQKESGQEYYQKQKERRCQQEAMSQGQQLQMTEKVDLQKKEGLSTKLKKN